MGNANKVATIAAHGKDGRTHSPAAGHRMSERRAAAAVKKGISYILFVTDGASGKAGNSTGIASTSASTSSFQHGAYVPHAI